MAKKCLRPEWHLTECVARECRDRSSLTNISIMMLLHFWSNPFSSVDMMMKLGLCLQSRISWLVSGAQVASTNMSSLGKASLRCGCMLYTTWLLKRLLSSLAFKVIFTFTLKLFWVTIQRNSRPPVYKGVNWVLYCSPYILLPPPEPSFTIRTLNPLWTKSHQQSSSYLLGSTSLVNITTYENTKTASKEQM